MKTNVKSVGTFKDVLKEIEEWEIAHPIKKRIYSFYHQIKRFIENIPLNIKSFIQRGQRGWSDRDAWNFDYYISGVIAEGVKHLKTYGITLPTWKPYKTDEKAGLEWHKILDDITYTFETAQKIIDSDLRYEENGIKRAEITKHLKEINKDLGLNERLMTNKEIVRYNKGWYLFKKYFLSLWD